MVRQVFDLKHGKAERSWQMDRTSNEPWTQDEFKRLVDTCANEKVPLPSRKEVDERFNEMQDLITKPVTEVRAFNFFSCTC
jgi:RNA polymerase-associated protein RTF1